MVTVSALESTLQTPQPAGKFDPHPVSSAANRRTRTDCSRTVAFMLAGIIDIWYFLFFRTG
jgi:hypothetical protein